jgi:transcriptional regulator with XRE-family HTH domain
MIFKDRLKAKRGEANITQAELAKLAGVSTRTNQKTNSVPADLIKLRWSVLADSHGYDNETFGQQRHDGVGTLTKKAFQGSRDIDELVSEVTGMFAGGSLSEEAIEGAMKALNDAYWIAKEKNKKYTPKKYRKATETE